MQICYKSFRTNPHSAIFCFCFMKWPARQFMKQKQNMAWCGLALCSRMVRFRGRPSEPLMFVWPDRPSARGSNLWLTHLSINFAKNMAWCGLALSPAYIRRTAARAAHLCVIVFNMKLWRTRLALASVLGPFGTFAEIHSTHPGAFTVSKFSPDSSG